MLGKIKKIFIMMYTLIIYGFCKIYCKIYKKGYNGWLISERGVDARDNAYYLYKYIKNNYPTQKIKYVISKDSVDRDKINPSDIVDFRSIKHYIYLIKSSKLISTHIMGFTPDYSLFSRLDKLNLLHLNGKRIFLQHGITQNYIPVLDSKVSNLDLFICGAKPEYDYIINRYGYSKEIAKYTGFARYDSLISNEKNQILIMPTWRKWLKYSSHFTSTDYFKQWNSLINNKKLIKFLETNNIELVFYPHYEIQKFISCFSSASRNVIIASYKNYDVQQLLKESRILITDYSSVHFDFAYMNKNVIYYQFDYNRFKKKHYEEGYFDFDKMAFGPKTNTEEELIDLIINKFGEKKNISKNIDCFFKLKDQNNCHRIYKEICNL